MGRACRLLMVMGVAGLAAGADVCKTLIQPAVEGMACGSCVNTELRLDDTQPMELRDRNAVGSGLFCDQASNTCKARLNNGEKCIHDNDCKSRICGVDVVENLHDARAGKVCYGLESVQLHGHCPLLVDHTKHDVDLDRVCAGGNSICWPESASPITVPGKATGVCTALSSLGQTCLILWSGNVPMRHTCNPDSGDEPMFTGKLVYCKPNNASWEPSSEDTIHDVISTGVCELLGDHDDGEPCDYVFGGERPNCKWGTYCKVDPSGGDFCRDLLDDGDACGVGDDDGCEYGHGCNLHTPGTPATGQCAELYSLEPGSSSGPSPQYCELFEGAISYVAADTNKCSTTPVSCTTDAQCSELLSSTPLYCDADTSTCRSMLPDACIDEYVAWQKWALGRTKETFNLRTRKKYDESYLNDLACCYYKEASGCLRSQHRALVHGQAVAAFESKTGIKLPLFMSSGSQLIELDGANSDMCADSGIAVWVWVVGSVLIALIMGVFIFILVKEFVIYPKAREERKRRRDQKRREKELAVKMALLTATADEAASAPREPEQQVERSPTPPSQRVTKEAVSTPNNGPRFREMDWDAGTSGSPNTDKQLIKSPVTPQNPKPKDASTLGKSATPSSPPVRQTPSSPDANVRNGSFPRGASVRVWYDGVQDSFHGWFDARIAHHDPADNTYTVKYDTGELSEGVAAASVRLRESTTGKAATTTPPASN